MSDASSGTVERSVTLFRAPRLVRSLLAVGAALVVLAALAQAAGASVGHPYLSRLPVTGLEEPHPAAIAVDSKGDVFVADDTAGVIDVFSPSGAYLTQFGGGELENIEDLTTVTGLAVDSSGTVYVADANTESVDVFTPNGSGGYNLVAQWLGAQTPGKSFGAVGGVAVDTSTSKSDPSAGDVYVLNTAESVVDVFKPAESGQEGTLVSTLKGKPKFEAARGLAVDAATGTLYVGNAGHRVVEEFSSAGVLEATITGKSTPEGNFGSIAAVAVEEATGDVYVADEEERVVQQFNPAGEWVGRLTLAAGVPFAYKAPDGVAVDNSANGESKGRVYVSDGEAAAEDVFGPSVVVPTVTTGPSPAKAERALGTKTITATLTGTIDPEGIAASYHFEYREAEPAGELGTGTFMTTPAASAGSGNAPVEVQAVVQLEPETKYEFRLVAENTHGISYGANVEFKKTTPSAVPAVSTGGASGVTETAATLEGSIVTDKISTNYFFEYGETEGYGKSTPEQTLGTVNGAVTAAISALVPGRTYHFRLVANNEFGTTYGSDVTFTTSSSSPTIVSESSEPAVPPNAATRTLKAVINPNGKATTYRFEYGEGETYGLSTPSGEIPAGTTPVAVSAALSGLHPATTYHFRVVAESEGGKFKSTGADATFTTSSAPSATSPALLDGRGYELVSPPNKHGGYIEPLTPGGD